MERLEVVTGDLRRIVEGIAWTSFALAAACTAAPAGRGTATPAPIASGPAMSAAVGPPAAPVPAPTAGPVAAADAGAPPPPDPGLDACAAAIGEGMGDYSRFFASRTPVASTRLLLRIFARSCRARFPLWAEAAERAGHVGRTERSRILGRAVADVCHGAETASVAFDLLAACSPPGSMPASLPVWKRLDAGTYALVYALSRAGLRSVLLDELILQASLTPELDR